jgi:hypothetical protein
MSDDNTGNDGGAGTPPPAGVIGRHTGTGGSGAASRAAPANPASGQDWFERARRHASPWIAAAADTIVPLSVGVTAVLLFALLEQARDALFGALGSPLLFWCYAIAALVFGNLVWYTGRVMATTSIRRTRRAASYAQARTHYPRLLAYLLASLLVAVPVFLAREISDGRGAALAWAGFGLLAPVVLVPLAQWMSTKARPWAAGAVGATVLAEGLLMTLRPPEKAGLGLVMQLVLASSLPTTFYVLWVRRRTWMKINASAAALRASYGPQLTGFVIAFGLIFWVLAFARPSIPRALGSPGLVMISLNGILVGLVSVCLLLRAVEKRLPGLVAVAALALLAGAALMRLAYHVEPWREVAGDEWLPKTTPAAAAQPMQPGAAPEQRDIVINSYGGGLRAAFYTAALLARIDDASCGAFGARINTLSGVSGGSLGIATYLVERQRVVAAGGWQNCTGQAPVVGALVEDALRRDHLSPVLGRMLTFDLLPFVTPRRGKVLLESWDEAIRTAASTQPGLGPTAGLAMPLTELNGGLAPAPLVLFNATDAVRGRIVWMSNRGLWGEQADPKDEPDKPPTPTKPLEIQLGQAVLHSARFPVVSPVGMLEQGKDKRWLVDGGLSDVSGAATLARHASKAAFWLNIDGNFDIPPCDKKDAGLKTWSTLNALLGLRANQATMATAAMDEKGAARIDARLGCAEIAKKHTAPLGWLMSASSAEEMKTPIQDAAKQACGRIAGLCRPEAFNQSQPMQEPVSLATKK